MSDVAAMSKRVIYEYHRIEVPSQNVTSDTVVYLTAQPSQFRLRGQGLVRRENEKSKRRWKKSTRESPYHGRVIGAS